MEEVKLHYGLSVAEYRTHVDPNITNIAMCMMWTRDAIHNFEIPIGSENYRIVLAAPEYFEVTDPQEIEDFREWVDSECARYAHGTE